MRSLVAALVGFGLASCSGATFNVAHTGTSGAEPIPIEVMKPDGAGSSPAVVIAHDCSGLGTTSSGAPHRWARELVSRGYVVIIPDSFSTRGFPAGVCTNAAPKRTDVAPARRVPDMHAALAHARALPFVNRRRVGLMGGSHGGSTTLATMVADESRGAQGGFAAAVALYPSCAPAARVWHTSSGIYRPSAPLLILIGEKDDWTPAEPCRQLAEAAQKAGHPVRITIYPGAHHSFDSANPVRHVPERINRNAPGGRGATTGGDPKAWADAIEQVAAFFAEHLK